MKRPDIRLAHTPKILISRFFIENAEWPAIARHPAAYAFAPSCLPPHACSLPLQRPAPLRVLSFARIRPRRSHSDIPPQAPCPGTCLRVFLPLCPPAHLRPLPPPLPESHMWGPPQENIPGGNNARERPHACVFLPGPPLNLASDTCF